MRKTKTFYIRHPDYPAAAQLLTQSNVTWQDVLFDCPCIFGERPPTEIAEGEPTNVVWP